jgi:hypothetical protein
VYVCVWNRPPNRGGRSQTRTPTSFLASKARGFFRVGLTPSSTTAFQKYKNPKKSNRNLTRGFLPCSMEQIKPLTYLLCPKCQRTVPTASEERYCPNDGSRMLAACPHCNTSIKSPYSRFCTACGKKLLAEPSASSSLVISAFSMKQEGRN